MKVSDIRKKLQYFLGDESVETINEKKGLFKCYKNYNNLPYQVLYVDCTDIWQFENNDIKNLEKYLENILYKHYYSVPRFLQWNFYYAFITDDKNIELHIEKKRLIEKNETYARKYVLTLDELEEWLSKSKELIHPSKKPIADDLSLIWRKKLREVKLDAVFLNKKYKEGVEKFMTGNPILESKSKTKKSFTEQKSIIKINSINKLELEKYRDWPKIEKQEFGKVNLITGINGAGKTLLLEAIELLLCGKTNRNAEADVSNLRLNATGNDNNIPLQLPAQSQEYKKRLGDWYHSTEPAKYLPVIFNKYNFYNSDAAYFMANDKDKKDIRKAFEDIALGQDVNRLEERLQGFKERFEKECRHYRKVINESQEKIGQEKQLLKKISSYNKDPEEFFKRVLEETRKIKLQISPGDNRSRLLSGFSKDISLANFYISEIQEKLDWLNVITPDEVMKTLEHYKKASEKLDQFQKLQKNSEKDRQQLGKQQEDIREMIALFEQLFDYYKHSKIDKLPGLKKRIEKIEEKKCHLEEIVETIRAIDFEKLAELPANTTIKALENDLNKEYKKTQSQVTRLANQKREIGQSLDSLNQIFASIKADGKNYLQLQSEATECPLCHQVYEQAELKERILRTRKGLEDSSILKDIITNLNTAEKNLQALTSQWDLLQKVKEIATLLFDSQALTKTLRSLRTLIDKTQAKLVQKNREFLDIEALQKSFEKQNLSEDEFEELHRQLSSLKIKNIKRENFEKFNSKWRKKLKDNNDRIVSNQELMKNLSILLDNLFLELFISKKIRDREKTFQLRLDQLLNAQQNFQELVKLIEIKGSERLSGIKSQIERFNALVEKYQEIMQKKDEYDAKLKETNKTIENLEKDDEESKSYYNRAENAVYVIDNILNNNSKSAYLDTFVEENKEKIIEIFKMIHSPREFEDIIFTEEKGIELKRALSEKASSLSEISTGQRAALALSVFLTLNQKLSKGPNIILFDDPVVNIDDMNILSFFDYLREVAIRGNRQIFFATANSDLAFLFSQKFRFLGEKDFKIIRLER